MPNRLQHSTSPYLLAHQHNPVDWFPWCQEAFDQAKTDDKPIFLSIGYSTCHWCHVMAHESFEDQGIADILNQHFISIKVDKEERPDVDAIYMTVCQAFTGSGGWPTSIFMTPEQKPFFAGTYFPKTSRGGMPGLQELLNVIAQQWRTQRPTLLTQADRIVSALNHTSTNSSSEASAKLLDSAVTQYKQSYDDQNGGFGRAPKFPSPHNLLFLLTYGQRRNDRQCIDMAQHTLLQMYRGGLFDHIGGGFCRYSTDGRFLVPHFEKMLYDNALLILVYCKAYSLFSQSLYLKVAEKTARYILREMTSPEGAFYSAQDADSDGIEGAYYLFTPQEVTKLLGSQQGDALNRRYDISQSGNFEGKSIPNLLHSDPQDDSLDTLLPQLYAYRKERFSLHLDDKILTAWNGLMIAAMCVLYRVSQNETYLAAAIQADRFLSSRLWVNDRLFCSFRGDKLGAWGFLDDYASYIFAQLQLYAATLEQTYLDRAERLCATVEALFGGDSSGGFYFYSTESEKLIFRPKETFDGAIPSGNSLMAWNLVRLAQITDAPQYAKWSQRQLDFLADDARRYPSGYAMFLCALLDHLEPAPKATAVLESGADPSRLPHSLPMDTVIHLLPNPTDAFPLKDGKSTYYLCSGHSCLPPTNDLSALL